MRNRVAHDGVHTRRGAATLAARVMAVLTLLPATLVIVTAQAAIADPVAAGGPGIVRPVGVVAVTIGLGGLVAGLLRRRRVTGARAAAVLDSRPAQAEPARTETAV